MDLQKLAAKLHPLERKVLPFLKKETSPDSISKSTKLQDVEVRRALQWLENKGIITSHTEKKSLVLLDKNGLRYKKEGLPEKAFLYALSEEFKGLNVIIKKAKLTREEATACLGVLKKKVAIETRQSPDGGLEVKLGPQGKKLLQQPSFEEQFLAKDFPLETEHITDIDKLAFEELRKRKEFLKVEEQKNITVTLTKLGEELLASDWKRDYLNRLTPEMLKNASWKKAPFRAYDVEINVPQVYGGKKHFVNQAMEYARSIWTEMGFQEMSGNLIQTSFWNFDALFTAQDHPVRELQDTFYVGGAEEKGKLPDKELVQKVKEMHEQGGQSGSTGWQYAWHPEEARKNVLRTHTTVLSAKTLTQLNTQQLPAKFFALGKCFRNEALDWSHLFEFNQTEGIVVDQDANFRHLLGYLKEFFGKMGFPQARFRPAFFPYTEPSVEIDVWHPAHQKWVELGGAGMFRPEVVIPLLGKDVPVLAWGPGFDRIILDYYQITDIRDLYKNDIRQLREAKAWLR